MASFNPPLPKYTQGICVPVARPITNVLKDYHRRKESIQAWSQPAQQEPKMKDEQPAENLKALYNEAMGNNYSWKGLDDDLETYFNAYFSLGSVWKINICPTPPIGPTDTTIKPQLGLGSSQE